MRLLRAPLLFTLLIACGGDKAAEQVASAQEILRKGDVPAGVAAMDAALETNPESVGAAIGASYGAYLKGDLTRADSVLAAVENSAGDAVGEIKLRRALIALTDKRLDDVRTYGEASGLPAGALLAAEVALADGERADAKVLLSTASAGEPRVSETAKKYLALIEDSDPVVQGLSEAQALWALGERRVAVKSVEELVKSLPEEREDKPEMLLVWAGRAAAAGEGQVASNLIEAITFPPPGQQWRVIATRAIIACANGEGQRCQDIFKDLEGVAPAAGLSDAKATAAILLSSTDKEAAKALAGKDATAAVARALLEAGDKEGAADLLSSGAFSNYLAN